MFELKKKKKTEISTIHLESIEAVSYEGWA